MGEVYRAKDTRLDRTVALEVLPQHLAADPGLRERFEREARAVSSLNHPRLFRRDAIPGHTIAGEEEQSNAITVVQNRTAELKK